MAGAAMFQLDMKAIGVSIAGIRVSMTRHVVISLSRIETESVLLAQSVHPLEPYVLFVDS
jgi:hypothetical protein